MVHAGGSRTRLPVSVAAPVLPLGLWAVWIWEAAVVPGGWARVAVLAPAWILGSAICHATREVVLSSRGIDRCRPCFGRLGTVGAALVLLGFWIG